MEVEVKECKYVFSDKRTGVETIHTSPFVVYIDGVARPDINCDSCMKILDNGCVKVSEVVEKIGIEGFKRGEDKKVYPSCHVVCGYFQLYPSVEILTSKTDEYHLIQ